MIGRSTIKRKRIKKNNLLFALIFGLLTPATSSDPDVQLPFSVLSPGLTLTVESSFPHKKPPVLVWGDHEVPFYFSQQKTWRALMRVPLETDPGLADLFMRGYVGRSSKSFEVPFQLKIEKSNFGFETITFPKEKAKLLNDKSEDEESLLIREYLAKAETDKKQYWTGPFTKPIPGDVLSSYGVTRRKVGQKNLDFHRGVDLRGIKGEAIRAPNKGRVLMVRDFKFHGKTVLLSHGQGVGSITIHMDMISVKEGQHVKKGQKLGEVGSSGLATAPHLHWGIYVHGKAVDPLQWLQTTF